MSEGTLEILFEIYDKVDNTFYGLGIVGIEELIATPSQRQIIPLQSRPYENDEVSGSLTVEVNNILFFYYFYTNDIPKASLLLGTWNTLFLLTMIKSLILNFTSVISIEFFFQFLFLDRADFPELALRSSATSQSISSKGVVTTTTTTYIKPLDNSGKMKKLCWIFSECA